MANSMKLLFLKAFLAPVRDRPRAIQRFLFCLWKQKLSVSIGSRAPTIQITPAIFSRGYLGKQCNLYCPRREFSTTVGTGHFPSSCQQSSKTRDKYRFYLSLDPPPIPLVKGDEREDSCPALLRRGFRGDRDLDTNQRYKSRVPTLRARACRLQL